MTPKFNQFIVDPRSLLTTDRWKSTKTWHYTQWLKYKFGGGGTNFGLGPQLAVLGPLLAVLGPCWWTRAPCARYWYSAYPIHVL